MTGHNLFISERMKSDDFAEQIKSAGRSLIPMGDDEGSLAQSSHNTVRRPCSWSSPSQPAIPGTGSASLHLAFPSVTAPYTGIIIQIDDRAQPEKCSSHAPPVKFMHMVLFDQEILYYILIDRIPERSHRMRYGGL